MIFLENLTISFNKHPIVHHLNLHIPSKTCNAIIGPNGCGKSSLLKSIINMNTKYDGKIKCSLSKEHISYLPQANNIDRNFPINTFELVSMGLWNKVGLLRNFSSDDTDRIFSILKTLEIDKFYNKPICSLSGGQFQKALFARIMLQDTPLIILDEPFNAIDAKTIKKLLDVIEEWKNKQKTILCVLHDFTIALKHFDHTLLLSKNINVYGKTSDIITQENIDQAFYYNSNILTTNKICQK